MPTRAEIDDLLTRGRHFCMAPWVHAHLPAFGPAMPCCLASGDFGGLDAGDLDGLRRSPALNDLRAGMLTDRPDPRCANCARAEAFGFRSERQHFNHDFGRHWRRVAETGPGGELPERPVLSWDLRFSNLCNFRCRMCFHGSSSRWHDDARALGWTRATDSVTRAVADPAAFLAGRLAADLESLEEVYFAGGEPLIMDEHATIVDTLLARGRTDVRLRYTSNLSRLNHAGRDVVGIWNRFDDVAVNASLDGLGARGELIRAGLDESVFRANLGRIRREAPRVRLRIDVTVSVFNVLHLPELHRRLAGEGVIPADALKLHPLFTPAHYSVAVLDRASRRHARQEIERHRGWLDRLAADGGLTAADLADQHAQFAAVTRMLDQPRERQAVRSFRAVSTMLDALRGESVATAMPELRPLLKPGLAEWSRATLRRALDRWRG